MVRRTASQQPMQRHAKLNLTLEVHKPGKDLVGTMGNPMHRPKCGDLGDGLCAEGQPFLSEPEDQDADCISTHWILSSSLLIAFPRASRSEAPASLDQSAR